MQTGKPEVPASTVIRDRGMRPYREVPRDGNGLCQKPISWRPGKSIRYAGHHKGQRGTSGVVRFSLRVVPGVTTGPAPIFPHFPFFLSRAPSVSSGTPETQRTGPTFRRSPAAVAWCVKAFDQTRQESLRDNLQDLSQRAPEHLRPLAEGILKKRVSQNSLVRVRDFVQLQKNADRRERCQTTLQPVGAFSQRETGG